MSFKGKHHTKETKEKMRNAHKGKEFYHKFKKGNISWNKGKPPEKTSMYGKHHSEETKQKIGKEHRGEKCYFWKGGISFEPYNHEFNKQLKEQIRQRDNYRCQQCFRHQDELRTNTNKRYKLIIHHIDYNKKNTANSNLIALCRNCHAQTNFKRENWTNYFQNKIKEMNFHA